MKKICFLTAASFLLLGISSAWADATVESLVKFGGFKGNGAYEGTTVTRTVANKQSESSTIKFTGAVLSWAAGGSNKTAITRIDKGIVWQIDPKKKTYTESPIEIFTPVDASDKEEKDEETPEKPKVRMTKSEFSVKKTGASETINGYPCEEYLMTWLAEMEDLETKARTKNTMATNLWTTPETAAIKKLQAEETAFSKAYMKKIGMDLSAEEMKQFGMGVFAMATGASEKDVEKSFKVFKKEMSKVKGYPIRTVVNWKVEGDAVAQARQDESSDTVDLSGGIGGLVSGMIGRKVKDRMKPDENAPFFSSTVEIKSIKTDSLPADTFEIPAGFVKAK